MNIAICEDRDADAALLSELVNRYFAEVHASCNITRFQNGTSFTTDYKPGFFSIVFMDVYMDGSHSDGLDTSEFLYKNDPSCKIIFTTSSRDFGIESQNVQAVHYLVKPLKAEHVKNALNRCYHIILRETRAITIISNRAESQVLLKSILYIEYSNRKSMIHTMMDTVETYMTLAEIEDHLDHSDFLRCHKSFIVNMDNIIRIDGDDFVLKNGELVNIRQKGGKKTKEAFLKFFFEKTIEKEGERLL